MRTYAPADTAAVLDGLLAEPSLARGVVHHAVLPPRAAAFGDVPGLARSADRGRPRPRAASSGRTPTRRRRSRPSTPARTSSSSRPTASGKSLCYALPVLQAIAEDPAARALFLFPTKALGQDQVAEFGELSRGGRAARSSAATYDGDTPAPDPVGDPGGRPGRRHQPGHAPLGDPAPSHQVVPAVRAAALHRHRRAAHVPRRVRQPRRQRPAPAAADLRPLRQPPGHRLLLGDDRQPGRAGGDADRAAGRGSSTATARRPASGTSCSSTRRSSIRRAARAARP